MWGALARYGAQALLWMGTASTGWFLSDWFNENKTTTQVVAASTGQVPESTVVGWWNQKRIFAAALGVVALIIWLKRGKTHK